MTHPHESGVVKRGHRLSGFEDTPGNSPKWLGRFPHAVRPIQVTQRPYALTGMTRPNGAPPPYKIVGITPDPGMTSASSGPRLLREAPAGMGWGPPRARTPTQHPQSYRKLAGLYLVSTGHDRLVGIMGGKIRDAARDCEGQ